MTMTRPFTKTLTFSMLILIGSMAAAAAATFVVKNTSDSGPGSLRQVVLDANAAPTADSIIFDASFQTKRTITLLTEIALSPTTAEDNLTITGPGANLLTITTSANISILSNGNINAPGDTVSISGLTLTQSGQGAITNFGSMTVANAVFKANTNSGAIVNGSIGTLAVTNCVFNGNSSVFGGTINNDGNLTVSNSTFTANTGGYGGAISNNGMVTVNDCTFTNNTAISGSATGLGGGAIYSSNTSVPIAVTITSSTFTGNAETGGSGGGGAISNRTGSMTINYSTFTNNSAVAGGGAISNRGTLNMSGAKITGNRATGPNAQQSGQGSGGGILNQGSPTISITNSVITGNSAPVHGGGVYYQPNGTPTSFTMINSTVSNNIANSDATTGSDTGDGGGLYSTDLVTITNSTISGNTAKHGGTNTGSGNGGGIYAVRRVAMNNCTVSGNFAGSDGGGIFDTYPGGANSEVVITSSTIVNNRAANNGGGIRSSDSVGDTPTSLRNTIVANNTASGGMSQVANPIISLGYNLIGGDPKLGSLADNGGLTKTHALMPGSPAIDKGKSFGLKTDQRGLPRPYNNPSIPSASGGDGSDIGAFEAQPANTRTGNNVTVRSPAGNASATFASVSRAGFTTFIPIEPSSAGDAPRGYTIVNNLPAYDITTTAGYTGPVVVCFTLSNNVSAENFARLRILHRENGELVDRTILPPDSPAPNFATRTICARVNSLSPFVLALAPEQSANGRLLNISTRLRVLKEDKALIGGFIITGTEGKKVIIRALGPSLTDSGVSGTLEDPTLELFGEQGSIALNDNWQQDQEAAIMATGIPPSRAAEAAIVRTLVPGNYTAVMRGKNESVGVGLVEVYDLAQGAQSELANISSRGFVDTGDNALIGGFIVGGDARVVVRALGPSLGDQGVSGALADPTLALVDGNGMTVRANDNWKTDQEAELKAIGIEPTRDKEAALVQALPAGNYTAIVRGMNNTSGVGLVEVYNIQ